MEKIKKAVEKYADVMVNAEQYIWDNPEVGYKEFKTNEFMIKEFNKLGFTVEQFDGITGFVTYFDTGKEGPTILVLAELDSLICTMHPECDKETGAVHNCGHNTQCAAILGVAGAIKEKAINEELCGKVKFAVVPAEEGIEISYRLNLIEQGIITFTSGKPECIKRGMLDDVDMAFMVHGANLSKRGCTYKFVVGSNGVVRKKTIITGKASHAGGSPWDGVNALYAAELALSATNALRETFRERDYIRFHSIITKGGEAVNAIPEEVIIESYVRGATPKAIIDANNRINRALSCSAAAMGAKAKIIDTVGSAPLYNDKNLTSLMLNIVDKLVGIDKCYVETEWDPASTDMGDVSCIVPAVHGYVNSYVGLGHGKDYKRINPRQVCIDSANLQVATLVELLKDNAEKAKEIISKFVPMSKSVKEHLETQQLLNKTADCVSFDGDKIQINI